MFFLNFAINILMNNYIIHSCQFEIHVCVPTANEKKELPSQSSDGFCRNYLRYP